MWLVATQNFSFFKTAKLWLLAWVVAPGNSFKAFGFKLLLVFDASFGLLLA